MERKLGKIIEPLIERRIRISKIARPTMPIFLDFTGETGYGERKLLQRLGAGTASEGKPRAIAGLLASGAQTTGS